MSFRFFRPWEDGGQGKTRQTPDPSHGASSETSTTTLNPQPTMPLLVLSVQAEQRGVNSEEATRSAQVLSDTPGKLHQEDEAHRAERKGVGNASQLVAPSMEDLRVSHITVLSSTSSSDPLQDANNKGKDLDCSDTEAVSRSRQKDKYSVEVHKTSSSIRSSHLTPTTALQNDPIKVMSADTSFIFGKNSYSLDSSVHLGSLVAENHHNTKVALDRSADVTKDVLEMNCSKVVKYLFITNQEGQSTSPSIKKECCVETFPDASEAGRQEHGQKKSKPFQCKTCGKSFSRPSHMHQHERTHTGSRPFQCAICEKNFSYLYSLRRHEQIHSGSKTFKCSVCQKAFRQSSHLHVHEQIHTGSKPYKCSICGKAFKQSGHLHEHAKIHIESKPFKCSVCQKAFKQSGHLHEHARIHTGSRPFKCSVCQKAFKRSGNLHAHKRIHSGSRPFKCSVCEKAFKLSGHLHAHERIHTGYKHFKCTVCKKAFTQSSDLHTHERIHTRFRPFKCTICEKAFTQSGTLHRHEIIHAEFKHVY